MGVTHITVSIKNLAASQAGFEGEFLVDTGAIGCLVSAKRLLDAGIRIEGKGVYELANGDVVEYPYGFARVSFMGAETVTQVIFGPDDYEPILGVAALENTGIGIDSTMRLLRKMSAKPEIIPDCPLAWRSGCSLNA